MPVYRSLPITISGTSLVISSAQVLFADGTAAAPSMSFSADPDTGVHRTQANRIAISTGGVFRFGVDEAGFVYLGNGFISASPTAGTFSGTYGSGTNIAGGDLRIQGGASTGTGAGGSVIFRTSAAGSSGSTANTLTERMRIAANGELYFGNGQSSATPTSPNLRATGGTGTNIAGADLNLFGGNCTGSAAGGAVRFWTSAAGSSGTAVNSAFERIRIKTNGQVRYIPLAADPAGAEAGDVYYNSGTNKLRVYNGTAWVDLH